jgi:peptidoglycan/LPS O-acetylase OafA/YrhL
VQTQASPLFPRAQLPALTGIRALAAFWVVTRHFRSYLLDAFPDLHIFAPLFNTGYLGVDLFFILSGFILTYTHFDKMTDGYSWRKAVGFLWLRIGRVWPMTAFVTLLFGLYFLYQYATTHATSVTSQADPGRLVVHLLLIQGWFPHPLDWEMARLPGLLGRDCGARAVRARRVASHDHHPDRHPDAAHDHHRLHDAG